MHWAVEVYVILDEDLTQSFGISERKQVIYRPLRNNETQREVQETGFARFLPVCHI